MAMENGPVEDVFPVEHDIHYDLMIYIYMLNKQSVHGDTIDHQRILSTNSQSLQYKFVVPKQLCLELDMNKHKYPRQA